jgi:hypothetical protein
MKLATLFVPMMLTFNTLFALSVHASSGAAVLAPANSIRSREVTSVSEFSVYWSVFFPVIGLSEVTFSLEAPSIGEWMEM